MEIEIEKNAKEQEAGGVEYLHWKTRPRELFKETVSTQKNSDCNLNSLEKRQQKPFL